MGKIWEILHQPETVERLYGLHEADTLLHSPSHDIYGESVDIKFNNISFMIKW